MVAFVTKTSCVQILTGKLKLFAKSVKGAHGGFLRACNLAHSAGDAKASLGSCNASLCFDDFRVYKLKYSLFAKVNYHYPAKYTYLRCRKANPAGIDKCIMHIFKKKM